MSHLGRLGRLALGCLVAGAAGLGLLLLATDPAQRALGYARANQVWFDNWPLTRGRYAPERAAYLLCELRLIGPVRVEVEPAVSILVDPADLVPREILLRGAWEPGTWNMIDAHLRPGGVFVDVGAHIGYHSLKAAKAVGPGGLVVAVEPSPPIVAQLRDNIEASGATRIVVREVACSDSEGRIELFAGLSSNTGGTSLSSENAGDVASHVSYGVQARLLDSVLEEAGISSVDVIKIDVEGAEHLVLRGAEQTIHRFRPVLILEMRDRLLRNMKSSVASLSAYLEGLGYRQARQAEGNVEWIPSGGDPGRQ